MMQLLLVVAIGAVAIVGWKAIEKEMARVGTKLKDTEKGSGNGKHDAETLEADEDGVYRPKE